MPARAQRVNEADLEWEERVRGEDFAMYRKRLGVEAGGERLGCSLYEVPAGCRFGPYHYHEANEEAIYVLSGEGSVRVPGDPVSIAAGDYVSFPVGEAGAHQVVNDSDADLRYLCLSTMESPDVVVYPDSAKYLVTTGGAPGRYDDEFEIKEIFRRGTGVDYWYGEVD